MSRPRAVLRWSAALAASLLAGSIALSWSPLAPFADSWIVALLRVARPALIAAWALSLIGVWCAGARRTAWLTAGAVAFSLVLASLRPPASARDHPAPARAGGSTLKVLTFNIWGGNTRRAEALAWVASSGADVVLLQEVTQSMKRVSLPALTAVFPYQAWSHRDDGRWDNATLARFPLTTAPPPGADRPLPFDRFLLSVDGETVALYNVHLSMPVRRGTHFWLPSRSQAVRHLARYDETTRDQEIATLVALLRAEPFPFVVAGDFNLCERSRAYEWLGRVARDSFRESGQGMGTTWPVAEVEHLPRWMPPVFRIDYVWLAPTLESLSARVGPELGSDHRPVVSTFRLPRPARTEASVGATLGRSPWRDDAPHGNGAPGRTRRRSPGAAPASRSS